MKRKSPTVHLQSFDDARVLDRFIADIQADDPFDRQHMRAAQVKVRVRRRKPVKVRAADGGEQQRIRLRYDDALKAWVNRPQDLQVLNGRNEFARDPQVAAKGLTWSLKIPMLARPVEMRFIRGNESLCPLMQKC